ncbi:MAG: 50S ribosomal protein L32 [Candidatus Eisenbacteria bacterium]|nr:50S ribosomal protein L32 [Candidatus Latescibacterota bacterium]MBD3302385.1 50S ribosomal protein L32 [Candidatus Eisenbacteria bacterium]
MALPKRRHSSTRRKKRRANWKLSPPSINRCPSCGAARRPHRVCPSCGHYRDELIQPK